MSALSCALTRVHQFGDPRRVARRGIDLLGARIDAPVTEVENDGSKTRVCAPFVDGEVGKDGKKG